MTQMIPDKKCIPVLDIFAGPGGLGEGFSAFADEHGKQLFDICLSIEKDKHAYNTLKLRNFFRKFSRNDVPEAYYSLIYDKKIKQFNYEELYRDFQEIAEKTDREVCRCELGGEDISAGEIDTLIRSALTGYGHDHWVLIGGPPCQAYSTVGRSRNKGTSHYIPEQDKRHFLYREYLRIISSHWPSIFVMENVKGILTSKVKGQPIFSQILEDLKNPAGITATAPKGSGSYRYRIFSFVKEPDHIDRENFPVYSRPHDFVIESEKFGIPQARHRVILLGIREDLDASPRRTLQEAGNTCFSMDVLEGLPDLRSGLSRGKDSAKRWQDELLEVMNSSWLKTYEARDENRDVCREIYRAIEILLEKTPEYDRGGETVNYKASIGVYKEWYLDPNMPTVFNSSTRTHLLSDLHRYLFAACFAKARRRSPVLMDFPTGLLPNHKNTARAVKARTGNFADRFRVQLANRPSTTIMSHISKDGHYYIHPDPTQCRSLTVREAARLQTFPDNYIFTGSRTQQYIQVGNAVPPFLAVQLAGVVSDILKKNQ